MVSFSFATCSGSMALWIHPVGFLMAEIGMTFAIGWPSSLLSTPCSLLPFGCCSKFMTYTFVPPGGMPGGTSGDYVRARTPWSGLLDPAGLAAQKPIDPTVQCAER